MKTMIGVANFEDLMARSLERAKKRTEVGPISQACSSIAIKTLSRNTARSTAGKRERVAEIGYEGGVPSKGVTETFAGSR